MLFTVISTFFPVILTAIIGLGLGGWGAHWVSVQMPAARNPLRLVLFFGLVAMFAIGATQGVTSFGGMSGATSLVRVASVAAAMGAMVILARSRWPDRVLGFLMVGVIGLPMYLLNMYALGFSLLADI